MAHFYGTLKGRGEARTSTGTKTTGISATAQSWEGSVTVEFSFRDGTTYVSIMLREGSGVGGRELWVGPLSDLHSCDWLKPVNGSRS